MIPRTSQGLQGPPFQPPVIRNRLNPECGGCAELWLWHLQVANFCYINEDSLQHLSHTHQVPHLLYSKQRQVVTPPLPVHVHLGTTVKYNIGCSLGDVIRMLGGKKGVRPILQQ